MRNYKLAVSYLGVLKVGGIRAEPNTAALLGESPLWSLVEDRQSVLWRGTVVVCQCFQVALLATEAVHLCEVLKSDRFCTPASNNKIENMQLLQM